ncbi:LytTR family transcriptional regulator [Membranihabitans maritimus]|uniref:LytTR family transcriptional regulator n=1 Tax=Membranihabitans maritimus TaxID=2904244 RepID=UPI001F3EC82D|nr:LytTR family transcriptional regulator [Membranihabitans maritimus]
MRKDQVYFYTFIGLTIVTFAVGYFSMQSLLQYSTNQLLQSQIESSRREANEISSLVQYQLENGLSRGVVINNLQSTLEGTSMESGFVCMFDWSGVEICHPNPEKVGQQVKPGQSYVQPLVFDELETDDFYNLVTQGKEVGGIRDFPNSTRESEIIYLYPVKNTDWIVAAHANIQQIENRIDDMRSNFTLIYVFSGILIVIASFFTVRFIGGRYEKMLEIQNRDLSTELVSMSKLNQDLIKYKESWEEPDNSDNQTESINYKKRVLTHFKDEIVSIDTAEIAYIFIVNSITYIYCLDGEKYTCNQSLEELSNELNRDQFFRANRQYILSIKSIHKIFKYGKNQLKIRVEPPSPDDIIISKNKAAEFKDWLNS